MNAKEDMQMDIMTKSKIAYRMIYEEELCQNNPIKN